MARKKRGEPVSGWINLDKPAGLTSTQAIGRIRRVFNPQKIGHAGTLDPLATGILPIAMGEATKTIPFIQDALKTYSFTAAWGEQRDTDDAEGQIVATGANRPTQHDILDVLQDFIGDILQTPPAYSAIKIDGQRAYDLARSGETPEMKPREVYIESLELTAARTDEADFRMVCGKGTYVRSLVRDMALELGTFGYVKSLRRDAVGPLTLENAISLDFLEKMDYGAALNEALLPLQAVLDDIPALPVKQEEAAKLRSGQVLLFISKPDFSRLTREGLGGQEDREALAVLNGAPVALIENRGPEIRPVRVFNL
ncbi:MAG: tRNA pseudouridine(55) synthase TruB [Alphaproteobacteria bacterium]|nr:tRNA pseudouridine(55) synthase TruB [Alphaproteobacteria bacterium]MBP7759251.1 tRNA pseudouridine(55) synthase TruB [Alphaproteobacteria bacterium]MBP7761885.1 tRNA pseudouridine(55) synthase TruB [Alphaproteobacteria bacterium]MBP7904670.1 tRNA pseudouridine(55) synthase TruB [Alphaproteobacteria bacterium]